MRTINDSQNIYRDLRIGRLNEPLPASFKPVKIFPVNFQQYLGTGKYLPVINFNQTKQAIVQELREIDCKVKDPDANLDCIQYGKVSSVNMITEKRRAVTAVAGNGLSGSPVMLLVNDELVLVFSKHLGSPTPAANAKTFCGPVVSYHLDMIQYWIEYWEGDDADEYPLQFLELETFDELVNQ